MMGRSRSLPDRARLDALLDAVVARPGEAREPASGRTRLALPSRAPAVPPPVRPLRRASSSVPVAAYEEEPHRASQSGAWPSGSQPGADRFAEGGPATRRLRGLLDAAPSLERRLEALVDWLIVETKAVAVFVTDQDGLPLANRNALETHMAAASHLAYAQRRARRYVAGDRQATTTLRLEDGHSLQLVTTPTWAGELTLGLVLPTPLSIPAAAHVARLVDETVAAGPAPAGR